MPIDTDVFPCITVVIPCYKQAGYLATAIESVLSQQRVNVTVIVVDDGSPDDSAAVAGRYDERVVVLRQSNAGVAAARNAGLARATDELVHFLDADDYLLPGMLAAHARAMHSSNAGVTCCGWRRVDANDIPLGEMPAPFFDPDPFHSMLPMNPCPPACYVFKRSLLKRVNGFDTDRQKAGHADWDLLLRVADTGAVFTRVPEVLVAYRVHPDSMSANYMRMYDSGISVLNKIRASHGHCDKCGDRFKRAYHLLDVEYPGYLLRPTFGHPSGRGKRWRVLRHFFLRALARPGLLVTTVHYTFFIVMNKLRKR